MVPVLKPHIFISYRRADSESFSQLLYTYLSKHFDTKQLFIDVRTIKPGEDFAQCIERAVATCDVFLAIIGPDWLRILKERQTESNDYVRLEVAAAVGNEIPVIPILVGDTKMPPAQDLPNDLSRLPELQAIIIRTGAEFEQGAAKLTDFLKQEFKPSTRGLPREAVPPLIFTPPVLLWISQFVVPDPALRTIFVVIVNTIVIVSVFLINPYFKQLRLSPDKSFNRLPWRFFLYLIMSLGIIFGFSIGSYTYHYIANPVRAIAPDFVRYSRPLPYLTVYASNARILEVGIHDGFGTQEPRQFVRLKFQLICGNPVARCDAGALLVNLQGIDNPETLQELVFEIRGARGAEIVGVSLKDYFLVEPRIFNIGEFVQNETGITSEWQTARIPLTNFLGIDLRALDVVSFFVDADYSTDEIVQIDIVNLHLR